MRNIYVVSADIHKPSRLYFKDGDYKLDTSSIAMDWYISSAGYKPHNIYITNDEEIKKGDWCYQVELNDGKVDKCYDVTLYHTWTNNGVDKTRKFKKIILTTDQDLINYGVQAIDDDFLEWFVKNPSCESVEVEKFHGIHTSIAEVNAISGDSSLNWQGKDDLRDYKIIIPKEEPKFISGQPFLEKADKVIVIHRPKQETLAQVAERLVKEHPDFKLEGYTEYQNGRFNGIIEGIEWQQEQDKKMYSEEELRKAMNWTLTQYFEFHECPTTGRMDHYVQSIKQQEQ